MITDGLTREMDEILALPDKECAIGTRWAKIAEAMVKHGVSYERILHPRECFVHPHNRGKLGLNQHNVHRNLRLISKVGADGSKLVGATAFELSGEEKSRKQQIAFNTNLIQ